MIAELILKIILKFNYCLFFVFKYADVCASTVLNSLKKCIKLIDLLRKIYVCRWMFDTNYEKRQQKQAAVQLCISHR